MLGLTLRKEFQGKRLKGTAIELANSSNTGATQVKASEFLEITYPSGDVLKAIEAISPGQGRPLVLIGERGQGKSHVLATLYHTLKDNDATREWLLSWSEYLNDPKIANLQLRTGMHVIGESLHHQRYKFLWELLFERHPHGQYIKGKWEAKENAKTDVPGYDLILELLQEKPTVLILDEFQTWYDGLTNTKQYPYKNWAFNFIQNLSEIAKEHPDLLVLVVSVRNGETDAYLQIHRVEPTRVDFKGPYAKRDRQRLLLHRLFENRRNIPPDKIEFAISNHVTEFIRLAAKPQSEQENIKQSFIEAWPFAPHLLQLFEDQVLIATSAQETRDLIRILVDLYKRYQNNEQTPIITAADLKLDDEDGGVMSLIDSVSNQQHATLREKALRNLEAVQNAVKNTKDIPHLSELISALWLRSLSVDNLAGAEPNTLQVDITRHNKIDDNAFQVELSQITENSFNIHQVGSRLVFKEEENPRAKLLSFARNDKLFEDGSDQKYLSKEVRYVIAGDGTAATTVRVIVLPLSWTTDPWKAVDSSDQPDEWKKDGRFPLVVLPESPDNINLQLGLWLKNNLNSRRNTIRFLLPKNGTTNLFQDRDLLILARATLKADEWHKEQKQNSPYGELHKTYQKDLRGVLKRRFDRFAVLSTWSFSEPQKSEFILESHNAEGSQIPIKIEEIIQRDIFIPEEFDRLILLAMKNRDSLKKLFDEMQEPRPNGEECVPWLGEVFVKEKLLKRLCAKGKIAINLREMENLQTISGETEDTAYKRMLPRLSGITGRQLEEAFLTMPQAESVASSVPAAQPIFQAATSAQNQLPLFQSPSSINSPSVISSFSEPTKNGDSVQSTNLINQPIAENIFNSDKTAKLTSSSAGPTSALSLLGEIEKLKVGDYTQLQDLSIKVSSLTGTQLKKILRNLPDGLLYELGFQKEE